MKYAKWALKGVAWMIGILIALAAYGEIAKGGSGWIVVGFIATAGYFYNLSKKVDGLEQKIKRLEAHIYDMRESQRQFEDH